MLSGHTSQHEIRSHKKIEQQDVLLSHRARELVIKQRTAQANQIRGLLAEYGIVIALGISHIREMPEILENNKLKLTVKWGLLRILAKLSPIVRTGLFVKIILSMLKYDFWE